MSSAMEHSTGTQKATTKVLIAAHNDLGEYQARQVGRVLVTQHHLKAHKQ